MGPATENRLILANVTMPDNIARSNQWRPHGQDAKIAVLVCKICLMCAPERERREAVYRLISLLPSADFVLELAIEQCLVAQFNSAKELIAAIQEEELVPNDRIRRVLLKVNDLSQNERVFDALSAGLA
jgi:hypothetical protein